MNKEQLMGVVRHTLTFVGGLLVMYGQSVDAGQWTLMVGAATSLAGLIWSIVNKTGETY